MEADWEVEIGDDGWGPAAAVIDAHWAGLVDLRAEPALAFGLPEAADLPALGAALAELNGEGSAVWSAKCDWWPELEPDGFDADEMAAPPGEALHAMLCYVDLLPRAESDWAALERAEAACRAICAGLHGVPLRCCRVDLVIRMAVFHAGSDSASGLGMTAYITGCGATPADAKDALSRALAQFAAAVSSHSTLQ